MLQYKLNCDLCKQEIFTTDHINDGTRRNIVELKRPTDYYGVEISIEVLYENQGFKDLCKDCIKKILVDKIAEM